MLVTTAPSTTDERVVVVVAAPVVTVVGATVVVVVLDVLLDVDEVDDDVLLDVLEVDDDVLLDVLDVEEDVLLDVDEDVLLDVLDDGGGPPGPQNCTFEMSGRLSWPTCGRPVFEKVPDVCGGEYVVTNPPGPPLTTTEETSRVEVHAPPVAVAPVIVTTSALPGGFSKT